MRKPCSLEAALNVNAIEVLPMASLRIYNFSQMKQHNVSQQADKSSFSAVMSAVAC
jgi:hypothetical protein